MNTLTLPVDSYLEDRFWKSIRDVEFVKYSERIQTGLLAYNMKHLIDIALCSELELHRIPGIGSAYRAIILETLARYDMCLCMQVEGGVPNNDEVAFISSLEAKRAAVPAPLSNDSTTALEIKSSGDPAYKLAEISLRRMLPKTIFPDGTFIPEQQEMTGALRQFLLAADDLMRLGAHDDDLRNLASSPDRNELIYALEVVNPKRTPG